MGSNLRVKPVSDKLRALRGNISATARSFGVTRGGMILFIARHNLGSIVETRRVKASEIAEHPGNWRDHPARGYGSQALT